MRRSLVFPNFQCVGSERLFPDPDPTLKVVPDPDHTLQPDAIPDPDQNLNFLPIQRKFYLRSCFSVLQWDCSTVFAHFKSI